MTIVRTCINEPLFNIVALQKLSCGFDTVRMCFVIMLFVFDVYHMAL